MKKFIVLTVLLLPVFCKAQILEYKADNGITYHLNDTVRLGRGSQANGEFLYLEERGIPSPNSRSHNLHKEFTNSGVIIKTIKTMKVNGIEKYLFIVNAGGMFRFQLFINDAILACEVVPCAQTIPKQPITSVADEIRKLKELLDSGAITQAEFDAQKKKLLAQ